MLKFRSREEREAVVARRRARAQVGLRDGASGAPVEILDATRTSRLAAELASGGDSPRSCRRRGRKFLRGCAGFASLALGPPDTQRRRIPRRGSEWAAERRRPSPLKDLWPFRPTKPMKEAIIADAWASRRDRRAPVGLRELAVGCGDASHGSPRRSRRRFSARAIGRPGRVY